MKQVMAILTMVTALGAVAGAQSDDAVKNEVIAAQKKFYEAYQACDAKAMDSLVVDDMMYYHSTGGLQKSKAELIKSLPAVCTFEILRVDPRNVRIYGDTAILFGDLKVKSKGRPAAAGGQIASQVFVKRNGRWLFAMNMSSEPIPLDSSLKLAAEGRAASQTQKK